MPLGKIQTQIVAALGELGRLDARQRTALAARPEDLSGDALDKLLQEEFGLTPFVIHVARARALKLGLCHVARLRAGPKTFERIPQEFCQQNLVYPAGQVGEFLIVAVANPFDPALTARLRAVAGKKIIRLLAREKELREKLFPKETAQPDGFDDVVKQIGSTYGQAGEEEITSGDVSEESGPIIQLANRIIEDAYFSGTSDIHLEPQEKEVIIRNRIDGVCHEKLRLPKKVGPALVARLKIMCNLDIAERRLPQDGRIVFKQFTKKNLDLDLRVSTAPLNHGEGMVMRILDKSKTTLPMTALGFSPENLERYRDCIRQPYGMILHCGPTGSGKSMTLYSALNEINTPDIVIRTAEDPIEYTLTLGVQSGFVDGNETQRVAVEDPHRRRVAVKEHAVAVHVFAQRGLSLFRRVNVRVRADDPQRLTRRIKQRLRTRAHPLVAAVLATQAALDDVGRAAPLKIRRQRRLNPRPIIRMNPMEKFLAPIGQLLGAVAEHFLPAWRIKGHLCREIIFPDTNIQAGHRQPPTVVGVWHTILRVGTRRYP